MPSLNKLRWLQRSLMKMRLVYCNKFWGMSLHPTTLMSMSAKLDRTYPKGMHIDAHSYIAFGASILSHDMTRGLYLNTFIGKRCFIGARSIIMPGVRVGDECIVAAGAVVTKDVPSRSIVAGNPAKVIRSDIEVGNYGRFLTVDQPSGYQRGETPSNAAAGGEATVTTIKASSFLASKKR